MSELAETKIHSNDMLCQFLVLMLGLSHSSTIESNFLSLTELETALAQAVSLPIYFLAVSTIFNFSLCFNSLKC